jgi:menaquinone-specific isochorismate synthase
VTSTPAATPVAAPLVVRTVPLDRLPGARTGEGDEPDARDLLDLLPDDAPLAWVRRGDGLVGWGEAARIETSGPTRFADADAAWRRIVEHAVVRDEVRLPGTGPVAFGSFAFDDESAAGGVLVVPRVVVGRRAGRAWLTTLTPAGDLGAPPDPGALRTADLVPSPGAVQQADGALTPAEWGAAVSDAVERIRRGEVDKVVLARDVTVTAEEPVDPRWVARRLADRYASTWTFVVDGLLGATPELLVRSQKGLVTSRVLAGTIRRTGNDEADMARAGILAHSSKDLEEHEYAVASVAAALAPFCSSTNVPDVPFVLPLPNVLHLASDVTGVLGPDEPRPSSLALAAALHPSAAVCGTPTLAARDVIRAVEHMDRDRYAGPVGWLGADGDGEWGIGLRSGRVSADDPRRVRIFAGCGVVAASEPTAELAESEAKLEPMRWALGVRTR